MSLPAGALLWILANISIAEQSILSYEVGFFEPFADFIGVDGTIAVSYILSFPANELTLPVMLMSYLSEGTLTEYSSIEDLSRILLANGWTTLTAVNTLILCLFHFPCSTTAFVIKKETHSNRITVLSILLPLAIGITLCIVTKLIFSFAHISS